MAFWGWITAWRRWWRRARFPTDGHIRSRGVFRAEKGVWLRLLLVLRRCRCRGGWRRVIKLNRWRWWRSHWWWRDMVRRRRVGEGRGILFSTAALNITGAAEFWGHKSSVFIVIHPQVLFNVLILLIWVSHLHNILALTTVALH